MRGSLRPPCLYGIHLFEIVIESHVIDEVGGGVVSPGFLSEPGISHSLQLRKRRKEKRNLRYYGAVKTALC